MPEISEIRIETETGTLSANPITNTSDATTLYTAPGVSITPEQSTLMSVDGVNEGFGEHVLIGVDGSADRVFKFKTLRADSGIGISSTVNEIIIKSLAAVSVDLNTATGILPVSKGGTGLSSNITNGILIGNGSSSAYITPPTSTTILSWNNEIQKFEWIPIPSGTGSSTSYTEISSLSSAITVSKLSNSSYSIDFVPSVVGINSLSSNLSVSKGGTGKTSFTQDTLLLGNGSSGIKELSPAVGFLHHDGTGYSWKQETGTVSSISITSSNSDLTVSNGVITSSGTVDLKLSDTGVVAGRYVNPTIDVDFKGRITSIVNGSSNGTSSAMNIGIQGEGLYAGTNSGSLAFKRITVGQELVLSSQPETLNIGVGVIGILKGGTGIAYTGTPGQSIRVNASGTAFEYYTPTNSGGSVTSVALTPTSNKISITGGPITSAGTISIDINEQNLSHSNIGGIVPITKGGTGLSNLPNGIMVVNDNIVSGILPPTSPGQLTYNGTAYEWASLQNSSVPSNVTKVFSFTVNYNAGALAPTSVSDIPQGWACIISGQDITVTHNVGKQPVFLTMMGLDTAAIPNTFKMMYPTSTNPMVIPEDSNGSRTPSTTQFKFRATTSATGATSGAAPSLARIQVTF